jgi:hypothetical protein
MKYKCVSTKAQHTRKKIFYFKKMRSNFNGEEFIKRGDYEAFKNHIKKRFEDEDLCCLVKHHVRDAMCVAEEYDNLKMLQWLIKDFGDRVALEKVLSDLIHFAAERNDIGHVKWLVTEFNGRVDLHILHRIIEKNLLEIFIFVTDDVRVQKIEKSDGDDALLFAIILKRWEMVERLKTCGFSRPRMSSSDEYIRSEYVDETELGPKFANKLF